MSLRFENAMDHAAARWIGSNVAFTSTLESVGLVGSAGVVHLIPTGARWVQVGGALG